MKKYSRKRRNRDVLIGIKRRNNHIPAGSVNFALSSNWKEINKWVDSLPSKGVNIIFMKNKISIDLPEVMNFNDQYERTVLNIKAIRRLSENNQSNKAYKLVFVNFDYLIKISTSAALVLTAELSKWDDAVRQRLLPRIDKWDVDVLEQFKDLGFFELFSNSPFKFVNTSKSTKNRMKIVKYIKGRCGDSPKVRELKNGIKKIVDNELEKWNFLHGGLTEAITNVSHHAYPDDCGFSKLDKNWYLSGSFNEITKELKIVFYDQGIGIPKSLPESAIWERVLKFLSTIPVAERKKDEVLLKAAVQLERTSTGKNDRGKGLQDMLEFICQREGGYLTIISLKGLFKLSIENGVKTVKSKHFKNSLCGTLIIWSVIL